MFFQARQIVEIRDGTQSEDYMVVVEFVMVVVKTMGDRHPFRLNIDRVHLTRKEIHPSQKLAYRIHDVAEIEIAGRHFVEHGRKQKEVVAVNQRDLDIGPTGQHPLEINGRLQATESAAENEDLCRFIHGNIS
jgi:hypothetical protein